MLTPKQVLVIGSGRRAREGLLPALAAAEPDFELAGVLARTPRTIESHGRSYAVEALAAQPRERLARADLVVVCVAKPAVPAVLAELAAGGAASADLLVDTPVLLFKHLGHLARLARFRNAWVAEDCATLPAFDVVRDHVEAGALGELRELCLWHSAYAYHGIAMARALFGHAPVARASRRRWQGEHTERTVHFQGARTLRIFEPRDYASGRWLVLGTRGALADYAAKDHARLEAIVEDGRALGFRIGARERRLDPAEAALMGAPLAAPSADAGVAIWMEGMKRVGLLRLLRAIAAGRGAYPLASALDDSSVDYHLEKLGGYVSNPLSSPRFGSARLAYKALTRLAGS